MSLAEIKLIEVVTTNVDFTHKMHSQGVGEMSVEYGDLEFQAGVSLKNNMNTHAIIVNAAPQVTGYKEGVKEFDFLLKINMRMVYTYPESITVDEQFLRENTWYFSSVLRTYFKFHADDILNKTAISSLKLALN